MYVKILHVILYLAFTELSLVRLALDMVDKPSSFSVRMLSVVSSGCKIVPEMTKWDVQHCCTLYLVVS